MTADRNNSALGIAGLFSKTQGELFVFWATRALLRKKGEREEEGYNKQAGRQARRRKGQRCSKYVLTNLLS